MQNSKPAAAGMLFFMVTFPVTARGGPGVARESTASVRFFAGSACRPHTRGCAPSYRASGVVAQCRVSDGCASMIRYWNKAELSKVLGALNFGPKRRVAVAAVITPQRPVG
jgi:hypothetical protein